MSTLAVALALAGGTALAAVRLKPASVSSKTVRNNALTSADLANRKGVRGTDVADGSLGGADLGAASVSGADLTDGALSGADLAAGSVGRPALGAGAAGKGALAPGVVGPEDVADGSLAAPDVGTDTLTSKQIQASSLGIVADAAALGGFAAANFLSTLIARESPVQAGEKIGSLGFRIEMHCDPGERLLAGGPANVAPTSNIFEDAPSGGGWVVAIGVPINTSDDFSVVVLCARTP